jgi:hypothetical protein
MTVALLNCYKNQIAAFLSLLLIIKLHGMNPLKLKALTNVKIFQLNGSGWYGWGYSRKSKASGLIIEVFSLCILFLI